MRRALIILALLMIAGAAHAQIELGPEQPAAPFDWFTPSAGTAAMATSTDGSLIAFQQGTTIRAQLLDRDGRPLTRSGFTIGASANATLGGIASSGGSYVVVTVTDAGVDAIVVSLAGTPAPPRRIADGTIRRPRIASNGRDYLVTWIEVNGNVRQVRGRALDANGNPTGNAFAISDKRQPCALNICFGRVSIADDAVASDGRDYLAGFVDAVDPDVPEPNEVVFVPVANGVAGTPKSSRHLLKKISSVFSGPHYTVAFKELSDNFVYAASVDANGTIGESHVLGEGSILAAAAGPLVVMMNYDGVQAVHLAGTLPIDTRPLGVLDTDFLLAMAAAGEPVAVRLGPNTPLEIAAVPPGQVFPARPLAWTPVVQFPSSQGPPLLVNAGDVDVLAWRDSSGLRATRLRNGAPLDAPAIGITPGNPAAVMAGGEGRALVVWQENRSNEIAFAGRIVAADGTVSAPFDIYAEKSPDILLRLETASWNGAGFVVAWNKNGRLWRACIDASGNVTAPGAPFDLAVTGSGGSVVQRNPFLVPTSYGFLLLYEETGSSGDVFAAAFHADGTPLGTRVPMRATFSGEASVRVASDGDGRLLAAISNVLLVALDERGNVTGTASSAGPIGSLLWTGMSYLLVNGRSVAVAARDGHLLAPPAPVPSLPASPSSRLTRDTIAYTRPDDDAGGVERLYVRRVILQQPRRRATRP
jgi:hypothetical protein